MRLWIVAYDIADNRRRRQLSLCLGQRLVRVQESIFEGWMTQSESQTLLAEAALLLDLATDKLRAYPLAVRTSARYQTYGQQSLTEKISDFWVVG